MNLRIITKNHAADPEKGFVAKSISKPDGCATAMPKTSELKAISHEIFIKYDHLTFQVESSSFLLTKLPYLTVFIKNLNNYEYFSQFFA